MDREKIVKMVIALAAIVVIAMSLSKLFSRNSMSLSEYARLNGGGETLSSSTGARADGDDASAFASTQEESPQPSPDPQENIAPSSAPSEELDGSHVSSSLIGATLNGNSQLEQRVTLGEGFYYEPISDNLRRYMTGISFPAQDFASVASGGDISTQKEFGDGASRTESSPDEDSADGASRTAPSPDEDSADSASRSDTAEEDAGPEITFDELRYVHILHYDFDGNPTEGELVCNEFIAADLAEIFQELYRNEYRLEKVLLIDEYEGDDTASMEDNNTSCFNYRTVDDTDRLSKHAYGLAIDINPLYNPYITYTEEGGQQVSPASALPYADRKLNFPYKITEDDLCCKLFMEHGFIWGGNWNSVKDYQHFQKSR